MPTDLSNDTKIKSMEDPFSSQTAEPLPWSKWQELKSSFKKTNKQKKQYLNIVLKLQKKTSDIHDQMKAKSFWTSVKSFEETSWNQQHIHKKIQTQLLMPLDISSILFVNSKNKKF